MDERMELFNSVGCAGCKNHQGSMEDGCPLEDTCTQGEMFAFDGPPEGSAAMFQIQGKYKSGPWEVLAERETREEAEQVYGDLRVEYGPEWMLLVVDNGDGKAAATDVDFMLKFASEMSDSEVGAEQLRCLWTALCLMRDFSPDTAEYDSFIGAVWTALPEKLKNAWDEIAKTEREYAAIPTVYEDGVVDGYDVFDLFMGEYLC